MDEQTRLKERVAQLETLVQELSSWKQEREIQSVPFPLDEASKFAIFENQTNLVFGGAGTAGLTEGINLTGNPQVITVPKAYTDTIVLTLNGTAYEVPYIT